MSRPIGVLKEIFLHAVELDAARRARYLDEACAEDGELRREVEHLLDADASPGGRLESGVPRLVDAWTQLNPEALAGKRVGDFRLEEVLAIGGTVAVFRAAQDRPRRRVALKLTRSDVLSPEARRRFQDEAEILGLLTHPNVARVYAAGIEEVDGTPLSYLAMEYVEGARNLDSYARQAQLGRDARLRLFAELCDAVQHGHQKGVVHRDLKPANVLVDAEGRVKVIDFGIARMLRAPGESSLQQTMDGRVIGTLPYMSPEQCRSGRDVDTRSDVYGLGVILYELLTEQLPFDLARASLPEAMRTIQETTPPPLSRWRPGIATDLERVVAKAMHKDREQRYHSVAGLARDVRAFLAGSPVAAHAPSAWYALRCFVRRRRITVGLTAALVLSLVAFSIHASLEANRLQLERDRVVREARKYERSTDFFASLLDTVSPKTGAKDSTIVQALDALIPRITELVGDEPAVEAHVRNLISWKLLELGRYAECEQQRRRVLEILDTLPDTSLEDRLDARLYLASILLEQDEMEEARTLTDAVLARVEEGSVPPSTRGLALHTASDAALKSGNEDDAAERLQEALAMYVSLGSEGREGRLTTLQKLADLAAGKDDLDTAIELSRESMQLARRFYGPDDGQRVFGGMHLTYFLWMRGSEADLAEAESEQRAMIAELHTIYGGETFYEVVWRRQLGRILMARGRTDDALREAEDALGMARRLLGSDHVEVARTRYVLAELYEQAGRSAAATDEYAETLRVYLLAFSEDQHEVQQVRARLAGLRPESWRTDTPP